jgi:hypothetical protein
VDYTELLNQLQQASLFDLYRLSVAIDRELENPQQINAVKRKLRLGMELYYFDRIQNRAINARLVALRQKQAVIFDLEQNKDFLVPYYMLNVERVETSIHEKANTLTANNLKVGDCVGFNSDGRDFVGIVQRLNHQTVTVHTNTGQKWRVSYSYLHRIHDAEIVREKLSHIGG